MIIIKKKKIITFIYRIYIVVLDIYYDYVYIYETIYSSIKKISCVKIIMERLIIE
jgi:hypothetical protein